MAGEREDGEGQCHIVNICHNSVSMVSLLVKRGSGSRFTPH